jgi:hypothetical protein
MAQTKYWNILKHILTIKVIFIVKTKSIFTWKIFIKRWIPKCNCSKVTACTTKDNMETKCWILNVMNYVVKEESFFSLNFYHKRYWNVKFSSLFTSYAHSLSPKIISSMVFELAKNKHIRRSLRRPTFPWLTIMCGSSIWDRTPGVHPLPPHPGVHDGPRNQRISSGSCGFTQWS